MAEPSETQPVSSSHGLGPHVVGVRVVVRRLVPGVSGPSGGPAMTDLLGVCEAWDAVAGVLRLRPDDGGELVVVPLTEVVTGKPVPPRASVRARVPAREAQVRGFALFPDLRTLPLGPTGAWVLRDSATAGARRANSCLAFGPSGLPDDDAVAAVVAHYRRPVIAVLSGSPEQAHVERLGWVPESGDADTLFQVAGVAQVARALSAVDDDAVALDGGSGFVTARLGEAASGVAALDDDWLGLRGLEVAASQRCRGLGRAVVAALVGWGAERGATTVYLQVLADNAPALALYARLGFRTHHAYRYLTPTESPGGSPGGS